MIRKYRALELLNDGAVIEVTVWGYNHPIYIRHNKKKIFDVIHRNFYNRLKS